MRVFILWSGEPSRSIARRSNGWIESLVQHVDAWMSDETSTAVLARRRSPIDRADITSLARHLATATAESNTKGRNRTMTNVFDQLDVSVTVVTSNPVQRASASPSAAGPLPGLRCGR